MGECIAFEVASATFAVDQESRTITGIVLPFGAVSRPARDRATGKTGRFSFAEGTVTVPEDLTDVPLILNYGHDGESLEHQVGVAASVGIKPGVGVEATFRIAKTPEGDRILALADPSIRILRSFSAEVEGQFADEDADGVRQAKATALTGAAIVLKPAFTGAQITSVAASAVPEREEPDMGDTIEAPAFDSAALLAEVQGLAEKIAALEEIKLPVGPTAAQFQVTEEPIYRFAGSEPAPSGFDFATDLLAAAKDGDGAALERVKKFTAERLQPEHMQRPEFVASTNVATVNPSQYRPDLFLGQAPTPPSPLYDTFHKGTISDVTPFFWAKLDRAATTVAVGDHVEGTDPTNTNLVTASGATVTPAPIDGKVHITRVVADQGGNPQVSGLVWNEFDRSFKIALENKTAALVQAAMASITALATITTGTSGVNSGKAVESGLVDLQFLATGDGYRFTRGFGHVDLYKALAMAELVATGEKVYPIIAPTNRDGSVAEKFAHINVAGYDLSPAWSLGTTGGTKNSLVADPGAVHVWNSGLTRLDKLQEKVEGWDLGVFGYFAGVVYDVTGLRKITYTP